MANTQSNRAKITEEIRNILGEGMVDVELDPKHYNQAIDLSLDKYRQKSSQSTEESYIFLEIKTDVGEYTLPEEVIEVREIFRRGVAGTTSGGVDIDPFELAYTNLYFLQAGRIGGLMTWDAFNQFSEMVRRLFGGYINFKYHQHSRKLQIMRRPRRDENVLLQCFMNRPEESLLGDRYAKPWLRDYALAQAKMMLGQAYSKFASVPGAQGGVSLNGDTLKQEAMQAIEKLEREIETYGTGEDPLTFVIG